MGEHVAELGEIVHVFLPGVTGCRSAMVVRTWGNAPGHARNLVAFLDGSNDRAVRPDDPFHLWLTSWQHFRHTVSGQSTAFHFSDECAAASAEWLTQRREEGT